MRDCPPLIANMPMAFSCCRAWRHVKGYLGSKMVTPGAKRDAVAHARGCYGLHERWPCHLIGIAMRVARYQPIRPGDTDLRRTETGARLCLGRFWLSLALYILCVVDDFTRECLALVTLCGLRIPTGGVDIPHTHATLLGAACILCRGRSAWPSIQKSTITGATPIYVRR